MKSMMTKMMGMMTKMTKDMNAVRTGVEEAITKAQQAVDIAKGTEAKVVEVQEKMITRDTVQSMIDTSIPEFQKAAMTKDDVQKMIDETLSRCSTPRTARSATVSFTSTAVVGNVPNADTFEKAVQWATDLCRDHCLPPPAAQDMYFKTAFKGVFFIKFSSDEVRQKFLDIVEGRSKSSPGPAAVWAKPDLPIHIRTQHSVLFGIRRLLSQWGYSKACINVDTESSTIQVAGTTVAKVVAKHSQLKVEWLDKEWAAWPALQTAPEFSELTTKAQDNLASAKGKGKRPASH